MGLFGVATEAERGRTKIAVPVNAGPQRIRGIRKLRAACPYFVFPRTLLAVGPGDNELLPATELVKVINIGK